MSKKLATLDVFDREVSALFSIPLRVFRRLEHAATRFKDFIDPGWAYVVFISFRSSLFLSPFLPSYLRIRNVSSRDTVRIQSVHILYT